MSGKHLKVRALRSGVGTPVLSVGIGLVAWVVIGLALVLLPHPAPSQLGGPAQAGSTPPETEDATPRDRSPGAESPPWETLPAGADGSPSAQPRTGSGSPGASSDPGGQAVSVDASTPPEPATEIGTGSATSTGASTGASAEVDEPAQSPWAAAPGKAKGHDKHPKRDRDEP